MVNYIFPNHNSREYCLVDMVVVVMAVVAVDMMILLDMVYVVMAAAVVDNLDSLDSLD